MSDYTRIYNLTVKDSLPTGNSGKVIKGTELDAELNAVAAAISSKADTNSPTFTGTPLAPTATYGTSTTQLATTAFVQAALQAIYPVGSVYINATSSANPSSLLGFGTWEAFGTGRFIVGIDAGDTSFDTLGETGGSKDSIVVTHTHTFTGNTTSSSGSHTHGITDPGHRHSYISAEGASGTNMGGPIFRNDGAQTGLSTTGITINADGAHTHTISGTIANTGSSGTNANLPPYVVVRMWRRTA